MVNPKVSVIIPTYNGLGYLKNCLESLRRQTFKDCEIIVVDNNSVDDTVGYVSKNFPEAKLIQNYKNLGFAGANNIGYRNSSGRYILFLNNDTVHDNNFLRYLIESIEGGDDIGVCSSKLLLMDNPKRLDQIGSYLTPTGFLYHLGLLEEDVGQYDNLREIFVVKGVCFLVRREVIDRVGLFDNDYFSYFEESDFFWRVWLAGYRIVFISKSIIYHKVGVTSTKINSSIIDYHSFKNRICTLLKNLEVKNIIWILPIHITCCMVLSILQLLRGNWRHSYALFKAMIWNLLHIGQTLKKRRKVQKEIRIKSDYELFRMVMITRKFKQFLWSVYLMIFVRKGTGRLKIKEFKAINQETYLNNPSRGLPDKQVLRVS